ncbi:hypothetical protein [Burkholderia sp. LMU1-1-1.1]|uniref:hypothetical protein n=1 Tax=Burkholderia sp. LMU1-1-1.1 TaxID=3135266 RepID=UPI0034194222
MMDEIVYSLLLKGTQGLTLLGTLRYRFTDLTADARARDMQALMGAAIDRPTIELFILPVEGTISVPLLTGATPVPISGIGFGSPAGLLTVLFSSTDDTRSLSLQINPIDATHIGGGLVWKPGQPGTLLFSVLGTQLAFAM